MPSVVYQEPGQILMMWMTQFTWLKCSQMCCSEHKEVPEVASCSHRRHQNRGQRLNYSGTQSEWLPAENLTKKQVEKISPLHLSHIDTKV